DSRRAAADALGPRAEAGTGRVEDRRPAEPGGRRRTEHARPDARADACAGRNRQALGTPDRAWLVAIRTSLRHKIAIPRSRPSGECSSVICPGLPTHTHGYLE